MRHPRQTLRGHLTILAIGLALLGAGLVGTTRWAQSPAGGPASRPDRGARAALSGTAPAGAVRVPYRPAGGRADGPALAGVPSSDDVRVLQEEHMALPRLTTSDDVRVLQEEQAARCTLGPPPARDCPSSIECALTEH
jgi:hypothetical protein